jgi:hypothetical protein
MFLALVQHPLVALGPEPTGVLGVLEVKLLVNQAAGYRPVAVFHTAVRQEHFSGDISSSSVCVFGDRVFPVSFIGLLM